MELVLAGEDGGALLGDLVGRARRLDLEINLLVAGVVLRDLVQAFLADRGGVGLLGCFGREVRDLLAFFFFAGLGGGDRCRLGGSLLGWLGDLQFRELGGERLLRGVDLLLDLRRDGLALHLLGERLLRGGKGCGGLLDLLVGRFVRGLGC